MGTLRRSELLAALESVPGFVRPDPALEQVVTPTEAAAELLFEALRRGDLAGRAVIDLGSGTGRLSIGAALLGASPVLGLEVDRSAVALARSAAAGAGVEARFRVARLPELECPEGTVVMNPPFGAQHRRADRPFWEAALRPGERGVYAFALSESRSFIERFAVEHNARIEATRPVPWKLPATFAHHRRAAVELPVDLWILRTETARR